jgi:hypothetical protein
MFFRLKLLIIAAWLIKLTLDAAIEELDQTPIDLSAELAEIIKSPVRRSQYISDRLKPQQYLALVEEKEQEVSAGPLIGLLVGGIFSGLTGGLIAGVLTIASGLIQILLSPQPQEAPQRAEDPNYAPQFGSNEGTGAVIRLGQPISAIFCSRSLDPTGGYTTGGSLINARIETIDGSQVAFLLYSLGHGEIGNVDLSKTLLNQQPVILTDPSLQMGWKPGRLDDAPVPNFADLSQNISARINQYSGVNLVTEGATIGSPITVNNAALFTVGTSYVIGDPQAQYLFTVIEVDTINQQITPTRSVSAYPPGTPISQWLPGNAFVDSVISVPPSGSNSFVVRTGEINSYSPGSIYLWDTPSDSGEFKVLDKTYIAEYGANPAPLWRIDTDSLLPDGMADIYSFNRAKYRSTKRVNQLDLNFLMQVWGRDTIGSLIEFAQTYILKIRPYGQTSFTSVCRFIVRSYNTASLYRSITIKNLPLYTYYVEIVPETKAMADALPVFELKDSGIFTEILVNGYTVRFQGVLSVLSIAQINALSSQAKGRVPQHSAQGAVTLQLLHVNEREYINSTPRPKNLGYPGLACVWAVKRFTIDTNGQLQFQFFVTEGIIVESLIAAGTASPASSGNTLAQIGHGLIFEPELKLRNLDKGIDSEIVSLTPNAIATNSSLNWEQGDRWCVCGRRSSCWWPEIKAWLVRDPRFGASESITADFDLNYPSLVAATKYCSGQNQFNQSFAWHGVLNRPQKVAEIDAENCAKVNLFPMDVDGSKGYWPMENPDTVGLFNITNADNFRITKLPELEINPPTSCTIAHKEQQQAWIGDDSLRFLDLSVTAMVKNVASTREVSLSIPECTSRAQAITTAKIRLNYGRFFGKSQASFSAKQIEAVSLELGGVARVQLQTMNYDEEQSGIVIEVDASGKFRLDNEFTIVRSISSLTANPLGLTDLSIDFIAAGVATGDLIRDEESGQVATIISVATHTIGCVPPIPADTYYQIANITTNDVLLWRGSASRSLPPALFAVEYLNGHLWYTTANVPPIEVGEVVQIGSNQIQEREFQVLSVGYQIPYDGEKTSEMEVPVSCASWDSRMFDFTDIEVTTIDDVLQG